MKKPGGRTGLLAGAFLTAPLTIIFLLGWKLTGLSFIPFDIFDWISRILPGSIVISGVDIMVKIILLFKLGSIDVAAKTAEQSLAVIIFLILGSFAGYILFAILRSWNKSGSIPGLISGLLFGLFVLIINSSLGRATIINGIWSVAVFSGWGIILGLVYNHLQMINKKEKTEEGSVERIDRRRFLIRLGGVSASIVITGAVLDLLIITKKSAKINNKLWSATHKLPNAKAAVKPAPGTRPEFTLPGMHYRIDIDTTPPVIDEKNWRLKINGLVENPLELTMDDIRSYEPMHMFITLECISNPVGGDLISTTRWTGVSLQKLLPELKLKPGATHLKITAADGFWETVDLDLIKNDERVMLAYIWDGLPLPAAHGFPLRIYIPDRYGMKQPKWIETIEAIDRWEAGFWVVRGWDKEALMKATSVIDTIAVDDIIKDAGGKKSIPVGGIAFAGDRGISKVEVRVDNGDWIETMLRTPLSDLTWVIWRYNMPFQEGEHTLTVRCFDGNGIPQIVKPFPPYPGGATGLSTKSVKI